MGLLAGLATTGCSDAKHAWERLRGVQEPVELPVLMTTNLPFHYPPALYILKIQGNVTLQLFIDSLGIVVSESTRVAEHGPYIAFDSAALQGAPRLVFRAARHGDHRIGYRVLFPIKFRVPGAPPLPDDTLPMRR